MNAFERLLHLMHRLLNNPVAFAKYLGVTVGNHTYIGQSIVWSSEPYLITIGEHVQVTNGVRFHTHGGGNVVRRYHPDFDSFGKIVIEDWAYIGSGSQILPGVTIGEGAIIGAGSIVTKSVPAGMVAAGNPAKIIGTVEDYVNKNMKYNVMTKGMREKEKKAFLLTLGEESFIKK